MSNTSRMNRYRWTAFGLVAAAYVLSFFHRMAPGAIAQELQQAFHANGAALGTLAATYFYVYTVMQIPTGVLADTLGPRRIVTLGGLVAGVGALLFGMADNLLMAGIGRTLVGLGVSVTFISLLKINAAWFHPRQFGTLNGFTIMLGNIGAVSSVAPLAWLVTVMPWRNVFVAVGVLSILVAVASWLWVRDSPAAVGLLSPREQAGEVAHAPHQGHWWQGLLTVLRNRRIWPVFWVDFCVGGVFLAFAGLWAVPYLMASYGMTKPEASNFPSLMLIGFAVTSFFIGTLSDRLGRRKPVLVACVLLFALCWLPIVLGWILPRAGLAVLSVAMGAGAAGFTLSWAIAKELNAPAISGMSTSVVNTGIFLSTGIFQPLTGWLLDRAGGSALADAYPLALSAMAVAAILGVVFAACCSETWCRHVDTA